MKEKEGRSVREQILGAALVLFSEKGVNNTTSSALARKAGIAEGTLFRHFRSKDDILLTLVAQMKEQLIADVGRYLGSRSGLSGLEKVMAAVDAFYVFASSTKPEFRIIFRDAMTHCTDGNTEALQTVKGAYTFLTAYLHSSIEEGKADGSIRHDVNSADTATILLGAVVGLARGIHFEFIPNPQSLAETLQDFCLKVLDVSPLAPQSV